ncbi:unnamed protein product [Adineta steineri]|uniref:Integral membrane bound transporter domain-containing protein n=2 Tax=Adineta steineri TaxID=433720 RepID=A0A813VX68_9BILA|nr:unnamed protein product [Adineta steineri]CAF3514093.1 unnamed protein product [Adineta steineri]
MSVPKISQTARHFYFNYHYPESTTSCIHTTFMRQIQFGIQDVICFLIAGFLAYETKLIQHLSLEFLVPMISILCLQSTFGSTLAGCYRITLALIPLSLFLFLIQKLGLGYHDYLATELFLLFTSFCISYGCSQVPTKKMTLLYNVIYFGLNFSRPDLPITFSFELLGIYISGMAIAVFVSLIIFPIFATFDIENRFNYSLSKLQQMYVLIIQAFLCHDKTRSHMLLTKASIVQHMIEKALTPMQTRLADAKFEPSRLLQRLFNHQHLHVIDLTLQEQENLITSLMSHVSSLHLMVKNCSFNDFHHDFTCELQSSLLHLNSCQSNIISSFISSSSVTKDDFIYQVTNLQDAFSSLRSTYILAGLHRIEHVLQSATTLQSEDSLSHAFFLFHLEAIVRLLTQVTTNDNNRKNTINSKKNQKKKINLNEHFKLPWTRLLSAVKSMIIIGVGSIFILVPSLSKTFENGQLILITLCVTQGDTVGGAFTTMKMRLIGTLLGSIWAYITYLLAHNDTYKTMGILTPWIFIFSYLKLLPNWGYTAAVATFTPIAINLGRLPYGDALPGGNYVLLRIEESFVGITIAVILTLFIFPTFAIDLLKDNIQTTLKTCQQSIVSMHSIYDQLFHHDHSHESLIQLDLEEQKNESFISTQRNSFYSLINVQRTLVEHASLEPTFWWMKNAFSTKRYNILVQKQVHIYNMLHNIDATLIRIKEYSENIEHLQLNVAGGHLLPNLHRELSDLSRQLSDCFHLCTSYFILTQTRFHQLFRQCIYSHNKLISTDLAKHEQCLIDLDQTIHRLHVQHQIGLNRLLQHYLSRLSEDESGHSVISYTNSNEAESVFIAYYALYYSTTQLTQCVLTLGETVHTIFELETTHLYRHF